MFVPFFSIDEKERKIKRFFLLNADVDAAADASSNF